MRHLLDCRMVEDEVLGDVAGCLLGGGPGRRPQSTNYAIPQKSRIQAMVEYRQAVVSRG